MAGIAGCYANIHKTLNNAIGDENVTTETAAAAVEIVFVIRGTDWYCERKML